MAWIRNFDASPIAYTYYGYVVVSDIAYTSSILFWNPKRMTGIFFVKNLLKKVSYNQKVVGVRT